MTSPSGRAVRAALNWPAPRLDRVRASAGKPDAYEEMDGLSGLPAHGVDPLIVEASPRKLNPLFSRGSMLAGLDPWRLVRQLWHYRSYDVLVGIDSSSVLLFTLVKRLLGLRKPVVVIDPALDTSYERRMMIHRQVLPWVQHVVVYGTVQLDYLRSHFGDEVPATYIPHRIDTGFFDPGRAQVAASDDPYVFAVGNDAGRDFDTLVEASRGLPIRVVIHTRRKITQPLPPNVSIRSDWVSFSGLRALYAGARLVVMPLHDTVHASGINSLLEAMSMARHVVVSDSRGVQDYVHHGATATVVPVGDVQALQASILQHLADGNTSEQIGQQARRALIAEQSIDRYSQRIAQVLQSVVRPGGGTITHEAGRRDPDR
jgi:glycosyltransferase involved in cell wall biosynthesis